MSSLRLTGLGLRLSVAGGKTSVVRLLLMGLGPAVGVAALLGALSVHSAMASWDRKSADRYGQVVPVNYRPGMSDVTLTWELQTTFEDRQVQILAFRQIGNGPIPPGVAVVPAAGQAFVSPSLQDVLIQPGGSLLKPRVPGRVVGTIGQDGLLSPGELVAYVGASQPGGSGSTRAYRLRTSQALVTQSFTGESSNRLGLTIVLALVLFGLLVPILVLVVTTARLSAATREARLATIRLIGASRTELRFLMGLESGIVAECGCLIGIILFVALRSSMLTTSVVRNRWFPSDLVFPAGAAAATVLLLPVIAVLVSTVGVRRIAASPLVAVRSAAGRGRGGRWVVPMTSGLALLGVTGAFASIVRQLPAPIPGLLVGAALLLTLLGLAGTAPWLASLIAKSLANRHAHPSRLIATRRLEAAPTSASRAVAAISVFLGIIIVIQGITLLGKRKSPAIPAGLRISSSDIVVDELPSTFRALHDIPGVSSVSLPGTTLDGSLCRKGFPCAAVLHTDGQPSTVEQIRNIVGWTGYVATPSQLNSPGGGGNTPAIVRMLSLVVLLILLITGASLLVSTVDGILERRSSFAALSAFGVPTSVLRRSVIIELAIPILPALILGTVVGLLVLFFLSLLAADPIPIPAAQIAANALFVIGVGAVVAVVALPWIRATRRPEFLQAD